MSEQQSNTVVMFRALVMLVCLVAIPFAAFCGSSLPTILKAVQEHRWPTLAEFRGLVNPSSRTTSGVPQFVPTRTMTGDPRPFPGGTVQPIPVNPSPSPARWPEAMAPQAGPAIVPVGFNTPADPTRSLDRNPATPLGLAGGIADPTAEHKAGLAGPIGGEPSATPAGSEAFSFVQDRLRQLGATYYLLEAWGDQKREYRFYCRMAIGGNAQFTRAFWAIDGDPLRAMGQVLQQVESWKVGEKS